MEGYHQFQLRSVNPHTIQMTEVNKDIVRNRFFRSIETYNHEAVIQKSIARELINKVSLPVDSECCKVLEIGCGTGFLTDELLKKLHPQQYILNDLVGEMREEIQKVTQRHYFSRWLFVEGDAEQIQFPEKFDLVISSSVIQWFRYPARFLASISKSMNGNGLLAVSTFGKENFREIKTLLNFGLNYPSIPELTSWLSLFFYDIHIEEKIIVKQFTSSKEVLKHIKHTGVNGIESKPWNKTDLLYFENNYRAAYSGPNNTLSLTYHPILITARKKYE